MNSAHTVNGAPPGEFSLPAKPPPVETGPKPIAHVGVDDIFAPLPAIPWMCEGLKLAPGAGPYMVGGYGYSGKTMTAQHIALCVAAGRPIFGVYTCTRGRVLHLDYEQGRYLTMERYQRLARGMGISKDDLGDRLRLAVFPATALDSQEAEAVLRATLDGFDIVLVDPYRAACPATDENSSEARVPLDLLSRACGGTCLALVLHHAKKPTKDDKGGKFSLRGSGALFDALAGAYVFGGEGEEKNGPVLVSHEKERWRGKLLPNFGLRILDVEGEGRPDWGVNVEHLDEHELTVLTEEGTAAAQAAAVRTAEAKIVAFLTNRPSLVFIGNRSELRDAVGVKASPCSAALRNLEGAGQVAVAKTPDGTKTQISLLPEGPSLYA